MSESHIERLNTNDPEIVQSGFEYDFELHQIDDYIDRLGASCGRLDKIKELWNRELEEDKLASIGLFFFWDGSNFTKVQGRNLLTDQLIDLGRELNTRIFPIYISAKFFCAYFETDPVGQANRTYERISDYVSEKYGKGVLKMQQFQSTHAPELLKDFLKNRVGFKKQKRNEELI